MAPPFPQLDLTPAMLRRFSLSLLPAAFCLSLLIFKPVSAEELVLDSFDTGFQFNNFSTTDSNVGYSGGGRFFLEGNASMSWTDSGAGIYNGTRIVTVDQYGAQTGNFGNLVTGRVLDNKINYAAALGVRADVALDYDLRSTPGDDNTGVDISPTKYLTFDLAFDEQARDTTRGEVTFFSGTTSTTVEISFENSQDGLNSIDLDSLITEWDWDATTWANIKDNITDVQFSFFSTGYGDDYSFATYSFDSEAQGNQLQQVPEPMSLLMFGSLLGLTCFSGRRRR